MNRRITRAAAAAACVGALLSAPEAQAQISTGRIDVTIEDSNGGRMPGVNVELDGPIAHAQVADARGEAHFLNLPVGTYSVKASIAGFNPYTNTNVQVLSGASTPVAVQLGVAGTAETVVVTAASPAADVKRGTTTTNVTIDELQGIPTARDPWVVMQAAPTVYLDRVNVGGAESGQQSNYNAKGAQNTDNTWSLDGVPVTDMGDSISRPRHASGASAFYYDFDSLQEMAITTGGADARNATSGVQLNVVLKTGTNRPHGSLRWYFENDSLQSTNIAPELAAAGKGNRLDQYQDYGFELGGPLLKDWVWIWGSMAWTSIDLLTLTGSPDDTSFRNYAFKADGKLKESIRGNFTYFDNKKEKIGRDAGPTRPPETTWFQSGPTTYYKGEGTFATRKNFFASVKWASVDAGFLLVPAGGLARDYYFDDGGVAHNTYYQYGTDRPQHYVGGDASYFAGAHELKLGASWRTTAADTRQIWPASHLIASWYDYPNMLVQVARDYHSATNARYVGGYITDTISIDRLTVIGGVRFDRQSSSLDAASVPGVTGFENVLPALNAQAVDKPYEWNSLTPRVGVAVAADKSRKTIVRASYAMFASQLPGSIAAFVSPIQYSYAYYNAVDQNGDGVAQVSEVLINQGIQGFYGFDPNNPARTTTVNRVDRALKPPTTQEWLIGIDREVTPDLALSGTVTYRRMNDLFWTPLVGVTRAHYFQTGTLTGTAPEVGAFSVPLYALAAAAVPPGAGKIATNRAGYHQRYLGVEVSATKRLTHHWMARVGFSTNDWREYFDDPSTAILDPTPAPAPSSTFPFAGPQVPGGLVMRSSTGSGKSGIYMVAPAYQFIANGLYEGKWGINLGASLVTRQGYAEPFFQSNVLTGDPLGRKTVLIVKNVDDFRLPSVTSLDARFEKSFRFGTSTLALDFDVFNLLNQGTVLGRQYDVRLTGPTGFGQVLEIMNPRIARLGARFLF